MASEAFEVKRNAPQATAIWTVKVSFPAFETLPEKTFYWGTTDAEVDGENYDSTLTEVPKGRHQADRGNDVAEFSASNPNNKLYNEFYEYEDLIERAYVIIKECYEIEFGYFESEIRFEGYLRDFSLDESDKLMKFNAISDLSRSGFQVGARILTRERCGTELNYNGLLSPLESICGWQTIQGGNPTFCSKYLKGVDGCISHNNSHRFYAIKGLSDAEIQMIDGNATGFDYSTGSSCFTKETLVLTAASGLRRIDEIQVGDYVLGFDVFTDKLKPTKVLNVMKHEVDEFEQGVFSSERKLERNFGVTREHLFYKGSAIFKPYGATIGETLQGIEKGGKRAWIQSIGSKTVFQRVIVYNIQTECGTYHISSEDYEVICKVHNLKLGITVAI